MKREKALDLIRAIAIIMIVNFHFCGAIGATGSFFYGYKNGGWGSVGVTLFFLLSGFVLHLKYREGYRITDFYKKRWLAIYPMFYLAFVPAYVIYSLLRRDFTYGGSPWKLFFSILGVDNYLSFYGVQSYAVVGEWFTTVILVVYALYPLLSRMFQKYRWAGTVLLLGIYFWNVQMDVFMVSDDANVITGVTMFWMGMLLAQYAAQIRENGKVAGWLCILWAALIVTVKLPYKSLPWKNLLGICIFIILYIVGSSIMERKIPEKVFSYISQISFAIYLSHHFIINRLAERLGSSVPPVLLYGVCVVLTVVASILLYEGNKKLTGRIRNFGLV